MAHQANQARNSERCTRPFTGFNRGQSQSCESSGLILRSMDSQSAANNTHDQMTRFFAFGSL